MTSDGLCENLKSRHTIAFRWKFSGGGIFTNMVETFLGSIWIWEKYFWKILEVPPPEKIQICIEFKILSHDPGGTQVVNLIFPWVITGFTQTVRWLQYILHTIMVHRLYGCNQSKVLMTYGYNKFIFHVTRVLHVPVKNNVHHQGGTRVAPRWWVKFQVS